jgi:lipoprotein-releasing system permease protein
MFSKLEFFIALRYLKSKRKEGFISVIAIFSFIGITIGVATLIVVMSVMNGFRYELVDRILGINAHLTVYSRSSKITDYQDIISQIAKINGVKYVNPIVESQVMLSANNKNIGGLAKGIKIVDLKNKKLIADNVSGGAIDALDNQNSVIIGSGIANNLDLNIGDKIKLISAETNKTIIGAIPRIKTYNVAGIFESGMYEYDSSTVFMPFNMAQIHFRFPSSASAIEIFVDDVNNMTELNHDLKKLLANYHGLYLLDWQQSNAAFLDALKIERNVMFLILTLIILVAAFNIISSMIMLVNDKNKNIALLRSIGMSKSAIMRIFLICGFSIGAVGTMLGLAIGVLFSANINNIKKLLESLTNSNLFNPTIYFLSNLPSKIFISDVVAIVLMSLILSFLATLYPAYKASKSNPADILRYE